MSSKCLWGTVKPATFLKFAPDLVITEDNGFQNACIAEFI
jgi:hypothetical protein